MLELADQRTTAALRQALLSADRDRIAALADDGQLPLLLATSDNGAQIRDHGELDRELDRVRVEYSTVRLHAGIGYVPPDDEHEDRGDAIRQARRDGLDRARQARIGSARAGVRLPPRQPSAARRQEATGVAAGTAPVEVSATGVLDRPGTAPHRPQRNAPTGPW